MTLHKIKLHDFRNYTKADFKFDRVSVVVGENGSGKSNLVEATYLLATGKSFRADVDYEMINYQQSVASILGEVDSQSLKIVLTDGTLGVTRKKFEINGVGKRMIDFVGQFKAVLFSPQDIELITGSPTNRRRYLDFVLSQTDREYRRCLISYEKGVRQRNKLLEMIREGLADRSQLFFWDRLLIKDGGYLTQRREEYLANLTDSKYGVSYDKSIISESRLKQYEQEEVAAAATLVGPHRDDFVVSLLGKDVSKFGSRGEQRMAVLWLKRNEIAYLGDTPLLLLDDIFSELDQSHREEVTDLVRSYSGQVIITTADRYLLPTKMERRIIEL